MSCPENISQQSTGKFSQALKSSTRQEKRYGIAERTKHEILAAQLNFALLCATTGSGISRDILLDMQLTSQLRALFNFHFYFTTRRILFEKGGIQSVNSLPGDHTFNQTSNPYDIPSYQSIRAEFGVEPTTDFRLTHGANHGLGNVFIYVSRYGPSSTGMGYPSSHAKFSDEGGQANQGNLVAFIRKD